MRITWRTSEGLLRDVALVCLADGLVGVSFGAAAVAGGLPWWVPATMSLLVFAGSAQFAAVGVILAGGSPLAAVAAGTVLNARMLPYGFAVTDVAGGRWWRRVLATHLITDETVAFTLRESSPAGRRASFWTCGAALFIVWNATVLLGLLAGTLVRNTNAFGLDAIFPAVLIALAWPALAERGTRLACGAGAVIAVALTPVLPAGLPVLAALGGLAANWRRGQGGGATAGGER